MWESLKKILGIPIVLLVISLIIFNPHIIYVNSPFILNSASQINGLCAGMNLSYHFSANDILGLFRFLEYFIFGIISVIVGKMYFKNLCQNVVNSMFLGLSVAVFEAYYRSFGIYKSEIQDILYSFFEFCIGILIVYIFSKIRPKKRSALKYKKNSYIGRS